MSNWALQPMCLSPLLDRRQTLRAGAHGRAEPGRLVREFLEKTPRPRDLLFKEQARIPIDESLRIVQRASTY